jgi:hypothetical protein
MGLAGQYLAKSAIFLGSAALCTPALIALFMIRSDEIDYARARNAGSGKQAKSFQRLFDLGKNRTLYIFAGCVFPAVARTPGGRARPQRGRGMGEVLRAMFDVEGLEGRRIG